jgi:hypothetical protein
MNTLFSSLGKLQLQGKCDYCHAVTAIDKRHVMCWVIDEVISVVGFTSSSELNRVVRVVIKTAAAMEHLRRVGALASYASATGDPCRNHFKLHN